MCSDSHAIEPLLSPAPLVIVEPSAISVSTIPTVWGKKTISESGGQKGQQRARESHIHSGTNE